MQKIFEWFQERKLSFKFKRDLKSHWNSCFDLNGAVCHWHWLSNSNDFISSLSDIFTINTWKRQMCPFQICKKGKTYFLFSKMVSLLPFFHFCNSSRCLNWKQIGIGAPAGCPARHLAKKTGWWKDIAIGRKTWTGKYFPSYHHISDLFCSKHR